MTCGPHSCAKCRERFVGDAPPTEPTTGTGSFSRPLDRSYGFPATPRYATAIHEAGHAVTCLRLGGKIGSHGVDVRVSFSAHTAFIKPTERQELLMLLAGPIAERWLNRRIFRPHDEEFQFHIASARAGERRTCDECRAFARLLQGTPAATDEELIRRYRQYEAETIELVRRLDVWQCIAAVADALMIQPVLHDDAARRLIDADLLPGKCHEPVWRSMGLDENLVPVPPSH